jgi:hypothetical protein
MAPVLTSIAIFILATTKKNGKPGTMQTYPTYFESRMLPIANTYGTQFNNATSTNLFFVFGTNKYDNDFLQRRCYEVEGPSWSAFSLSSSSSPDSSHRRRSLKAHVEQTPSRDRLETHKCPIRRTETYTFQKQKRLPYQSQSAAVPTIIENDRNITILRAANCTGEYFGIGPTCRCQEMLRYFLQSPPPSPSTGGTILLYFLFRYSIYSIYLSGSYQGS